MKQQNKSNEETTNQYKWISNYRAALLGSSLMLIGLLGIYGCSKNTEQQTAMMSPHPPAPPSSPVSQSPAAATANPPAAPKRIVQRRSPTATYTNEAYGISFRYPLSYKLKELNVPAGDAKPAALEQAMGDDPGEVPLATVQVPKSAYPKTDFDDGYFSVSANRTLTEETCKQSVITHEDSEVLTEKVNGVEFHWTENSGAEGQNHSEWHSYAAFANGTCYEVQLGIDTAMNTEMDKKPVRKVNSDRVFSRLQAILSSMKIRPVAVPAVEPPARSFNGNPGTSSAAAALTITSVNSEVVCPNCPSSVSQAYVVAGSPLDIVGHGFLPSNTVWIGSLGIPAQSEKDNGSIHLSVPESLPVGTYELYVANHSGKSDAVTVVVRPPAVEHSDNTTIGQSTARAADTSKQQ